MTGSSWKAVFVLILIISFMQATLIHAGTSDELDLPQTKINPGNFYYNFKRLWEKGIGILQFSKQSKITFYQSQLRVRLAELNYVVENKLLSEVQSSSERFAYYAGVLTEELIRENKNREQTIREFDRFSKFLEKLRDNYPANSSFWMLVQHDINSLKILAERLK